MERVFKLILLGDPSVGKTSLRKRYMGVGFKKDYKVTIGADFTTKRMKVNDVIYMIQIWDLSGQSSFESVRKIYYRNTDGVLLIFDITNINSFHNITRWINELKSSTHFHDQPFILVANKLDLISSESKKKYYDEPLLHDIEFHLGYPIETQFTSALTGENVEAIFENLIKKIMSSNK